jgi:(R,R)-butanediol dehydrogenase/meso-butanediol dehydrogenase/diacetyl reductase
VIVGTYPKRPVVNMDKIGLEEREVIGSLAYADDFPRAISMLGNGSVDLSSCVTGRIAMRDIVAQGFERMDAEANEQIRIIVDTHAV